MEEIVVSKIILAWWDVNWQVEQKFLDSLSFFQYKLKNTMISKTAPPWWQQLISFLRSSFMHSSMLSSHTNVCTATASNAFVFCTFKGHFEDKKALNTLVKNLRHWIPLNWAFINVCGDLEYGHLIYLASDKPKQEMIFSSSFECVLFSKLQQNAVSWYTFKHCKNYTDHLYQNKKLTPTIF